MLSVGYNRPATIVVSVVPMYIVPVSLRRSKKDLAYLFQFRKIHRRTSRVLLRQRWTTILLALVMSGALISCGTNTPPSIQGVPSATAAIACPGGNLPCSAHIEVPLILIDGSDPATYGIPMSCSITAGDQAMKFTTATSQPWFAASPVSGTLQPGGNTTITVPSLNASGVSGRNLGQVAVSASGYSTNSQMAVELNCNVTNIAAGKCLVAYSCNPKTNPLP
jgi:hypothetical protein